MPFSATLTYIGCSQSVCVHIGILFVIFVAIRIQICFLAVLMVRILQLQQTIVDCFQVGRRPLEPLSRRSMVFTIISLYEILLCFLRIILLFPPEMKITSHF